MKMRPGHHARRLFAPARRNIRRTTTARLRRPCLPPAQRASSLDALVIRRTDHAEDYVFGGVGKYIRRIAWRETDEGAHEMRYVPKACFGAPPRVTPDDP